MNLRAIIIGMIHQLIVVGGTTLVMKSLREVSIQSPMDVFPALIRWKTMLGLVMIVCGFGIMQYLLKIVNLNYAMPLTSGTGMVATLLISYFILHEPISWRVFAGMFLIFSGIFIMSLKS